jgi:hypothetical protein
MKKVWKHLWFLFLLLIGLASLQFFTLQKAHSTFENYAAFRDCQQITSKTDDLGTCITNSSESITIVKINNKWYLEGDGPGV